MKKALMQYMLSIFNEKMLEQKRITVEEYKHIEAQIQTMEIE